MLIEKMLDEIHRRGMLGRGDTVVVAVSGGPDSVALVHALHAVQEDLGISLHIAHLNHGIRGKEADKDAQFVEQLAEWLEVPRTIETADVPAIKTLLRLSTQEAARKIRYEFLARTADQVGAARIATAHNADDQAETVLMNMIRGAGLDGLAGIPPVRGRYIRPLLSVSRSEIEQYCAEHNLRYRIDQSNLKTNYRRNRVRLELIPLLESQYNPAIKSALSGTAEILRDEADFLAQTAYSFLEIVTTRVEPPEIVFDLNRFINAPTALARRCLRMAIDLVKGDLRDVEFKQVERILQRLEAGEDFTLTLPSGIVYAKRKGPNLALYRVEPEPKAPIVEQELPVPGQVGVPELSIKMTTEELPMPVDYRRPPASLDVVVDRDSAKGRLVVRNWRPGDRIQPLGMQEEKKLQDIFIDAKVPKARRNYIPIVADEEKIIWIAGFSLSDLAKITNSSAKALRLTCEPLQ